MAPCREQQKHICATHVDSAQHTLLCACYGTMRNRLRMNQCLSFPEHCASFPHISQNGNCYRMRTFSILTVLLGGLVSTTTSELRKRSDDVESQFLGNLCVPGATLFDDSQVVSGRYGRVTKVQLWCGPDVVWAVQTWFDGQPGHPDVRHKQGGLPGRGVYKELLVNSNEAITQVEYDNCLYDGVLKNLRICFLSLSKTVLGQDGSQQITGSVRCGQENRSGKP